MLKAEVMHIFAENFALNGSARGLGSWPSQDGSGEAEVWVDGEHPSGMLLQPQLDPKAGDAVLLCITVKSQCFLLNTGMSENAQYRCNFIRAL